MTTNPITLYVNKEAPNRAAALLSHSESFNPYPAKELNWVLGDLYDLSIIFLDKQGTTSSLDNGSTVKVGLGLVGEPVLSLGTANFVSDSTYNLPFGANTYEVSYELQGFSKRTFTLDIQVSSGSFVSSYQYPVVVNNQVVINPLVHVTGSVFVVNALSASYAVSATNADTASYVHNGDIFLDAVSLRVGSGDEQVTIDANEVSIAGVIELSNQGLTAGFSAPDITTISNGTIIAPRITGSLFGTASYAPTNLELIANGLQIGSLNITPSQIDISGQTFISDQGFYTGNNTFLESNNFRVGFGGNITEIANGIITNANSIISPSITGSLFSTGKGYFEKGFRILSSSLGATAGKATLSSGKVLVNTTAVNNTCGITLTAQNGDAGYLWVGNRTPNVSFAITSSTSNNNTVFWQIIDLI